MRKRGNLHRGSPIYLPSGHATITLVPEVAERHLFGLLGKNGTNHELAPEAIFVIDEHGVSRLKIADRRRMATTAMVTSTLLALLQYYLLSRRWKKHGRVHTSK